VVITIKVKVYYPPSVSCGKDLSTSSNLMLTMKTEDLVSAEFEAGKIVRHCGQ
jgi:hypothetical protein